MVPPFDPWAEAGAAPRGEEAARTARLVGTEPGKVKCLVKLHDYRGRAIYVYNLTTGEMRHIARPTDDVWANYSQAGTPCKHLPGVQAKDVATWIKHGKSEARRLGLSIEE